MIGTFCTFLLETEIRTRLSTGATPYDESNTLFWLYFGKNFKFKVERSELFKIKNEIIRYSFKSTPASRSDVWTEERIS